MEWWLVQSLRWLFGLAGSVCALAGREAVGVLDRASAILPRAGWPMKVWLRTGILLQRIRWTGRFAGNSPNPGELLASCSIPESKAAWCSLIAAGPLGPVSGDAPPRKSLPEKWTRERTGKMRSRSERLRNVQRSRGTDRTGRHNGSASSTAFHGYGVLWTAGDRCVPSRICISGGVSVSLRKILQRDDLSCCEMNLHAHPLSTSIPAYRWSSAMTI